MTGTPYQKQIVMHLPAAAATGIAASQSGTAATPLTLSGSLVTSGVANLVVARRVIVTSAGNDSSITFTIVGTDRYGRSQTEVLTGASGVAQTSHDFLTVTSITPSGNTASTVTAGTNSVGSSDAYICDAAINRADYSASVVVSGTVTYIIEESYDDIGPNYDQAANTVNWFTDPIFNAQTANQAGILSGPFTMIRLTINSGTGTATARIITPMGVGPF
jgi:hypothetical protein